MKVLVTGGAGFTPPLFLRLDRLASKSMQRAPEAQPI